MYVDSNMGNRNIQTSILKNAYIFNSNKKIEPNRKKKHLLLHALHTCTKFEKSRDNNKKSYAY